MAVIKLSDISLDSDLQPRVTITQSVVDEYTDAMRSRENFPPITIFNDGTITGWQMAIIDFMRLERRVSKSLVRNSALEQS